MDVNEWDYLELDVDDLAEDLVGHLEHLDLLGQQRRVGGLLQLFQVALQEVEDPLARLGQLHQRPRAGAPQLGEQLRLPSCQQPTS